MKRWQFWNLKNVPPADRRELIKAEWDAETGRISLVNTADRLGVYMAHVYVNPNNLAALGPIIADLISEAQKAGYLEAQRDMREALGL